MKIVYVFFGGLLLFFGGIFGGFTLVEEQDKIVGEKSSMVPLGKKNEAPPVPEKAHTIPPIHRDSSYFPAIQEADFQRFFHSNTAFWCDGFDFPVGKPDAQGYYKSQNFGDNHHLGEDWNGNGGGNTDLGDPVFATANGLVTFVGDICCGWGNTVRMVHFRPEQPEQPYIESVYSHLHSIHVEVGSLIRRGEQVGTIGTAHGRYIAHLHFEMRDFVNMSIGPGYSDDQLGYIDPTPFIEAHRPIR